ncbi:MAG: endonuclease III [Bacteroidia bacterium]
MAKIKKTDWNVAFKPLIAKYGNKHHPLHYKNIYQLLVMVVLSAQSTDNLINDMAPALFKKYKSMDALSKAKKEELLPFINKVRGALKKADWLMRIAQQVKKDKNIPLTMEGLVELPGLGRKSANVIMREAHVKAEGVIVDLHVLRVASRLGIAKGDDAKDIEKQIMAEVDEKNWGEVGMAMSFLGREICRPTDPKHGECVMNEVCDYFKKLHKVKKTK